MRDLVPLPDATGAGRDDVHARLQVGVRGHVEQHRSPGAVPADRPGFGNEIVVSPGDVNVAIVEVRESFEDGGGVDLDVRGTLQRDLVLTVTVTVQLTGSAGSGSEEDDVEAWSTIVPEAMATTFTVTVGTRSGGRVIARGSIWNVAG